MEGKRRMGDNVCLDDRDEGRGGTLADWMGQRAGYSSS